MAGKTSYVAGLALWAFISIATAPRVHADVLTWVGGSAGEFNDPGSWDANAVPGPTDVARINTPATISVTGAVAVGQLDIDKNLALSGDPITLSGVGGVLLSAFNATVIIDNPIVLAGDGAVTIGTSVGPFTMELAGAISGPHALQLQPDQANTIELTATNTYTGGTVIDAAGQQGTVLVSATGAFGAGPVQFSDRGLLRVAIDELSNALDFDGRSVTITADVETTLSGSISGVSGWNTTFGGSRITLSGDNALLDRGVVVQASGVLAVASDSALGTTTWGTTVLTGASLEVGGGVSLAEPIGLSTGTSTLTSTSGDNLLAGPVGPGQYLDIDVVQGTLTTSGEVAAVVDKYGAGELYVAGTIGQSVAIASIGVHEGTLSLGAGATIYPTTTTVHEGATLSGHGQVSGAAVVAGSIAPGFDDVGALTIAGDLTISGTLDAEVSGSTADRVVVTNGGSVGLTGGSLVLTASPDPDTSFILIDAGAGSTIQGTFDGLAEGAAIGGFTITYAGGDGNDVVLTPEEPPNVAPVADAGPDQSITYTVDPPAVQLDGCASSDGDGPLPLTFAWQQVSGEPVVLSDPQVCDPTFVAPAVAAQTMEVLTFELVVSDGEASAADSVNVTVSSDNLAPVCDLSAPASVVEGTMDVVLDATGSYDPNDDQLSYAWAQTAGPTVPLTPAGATATFDASELTGGDPGASESLEFEVLVSDSELSQSCSVTVVIDNLNHPPEVYAGPDQTGEPGSVVTLTATAADPDNDPLTFQWAQTDGPPVGLTGAGAATATFVVPAAPSGTELAFEVLADDGFGGTATDQVTIIVAVEGDPPVCDAARATPARLWPPNRKLVRVVIDGVGGADAVTVVAVHQDEPVGDEPDAVITATDVLIRAERERFGNGRVYELELSATNAYGSCTDVVEVCVPQKRKDDCVGDGGSYDSTTP